MSLGEFEAIIFLACYVILMIFVSVWAVRSVREYRKKLDPRIRIMEQARDELASIRIVRIVDWQTDNKWDSFCAEEAKYRS